MLGNYTNSFISAVSVSVNLCWRHGSQFFFRRPGTFPFRVALSIIFQEGFKVSVSSWVNNQRKKRMRRLRSSVQFRIRKSFRWVTSRKPKANRQSTLSSVWEEHDTIAIDAAIKLERLAKRRLDKARTTFEAAAQELSEAEKELTTAKKYTKSVKSCCKEKERVTSEAWEHVMDENDATTLRTESRR